MKAKILLAALAGVASLTASAASAAVVYKLEAFTSFFTLEGSFTYVSPDFISQSGQRDVALADLSSCNLVVPAAACDRDVLFSNTVSPSYDIVGFGSGNFIAFYYFEDGALSSFGVYDSVVFGPDQAGRLTVSLAAVPEPATWAMMISGFGLAGAVLRRRRALAAA